MNARETRGEEMVDRYANLVYRLAFARTRSRDAADEIFQEVFLRYVSRQPAFDSEAHAKAWFCRVTVNCANSYWRNPFRRRTAPLDAAAELAAPEPEEARLDGYLDKLPPELRAAVHLYGRTHDGRLERVTVSPLSVCADFSTPEGQASPCQVNGAELPLTVTLADGTVLTPACTAEVWSQRVGWIAWEFEDPIALEDVESVTLGGEIIPIP